MTLSVLRSSSSTFEDFWQFCFLFHRAREQSDGLQGSMSMDIYLRCALPKLHLASLSRVGCEAMFAVEGRVRHRPPQRPTAGFGCREPQARICEAGSFFSRQVCVWFWAPRRVLRSSFLVQYSHFLTSRFFEVGGTSSSRSEWRAAQRCLQFPEGEQLGQVCLV